MNLVISALAWILWMQSRVVGLEPNWIPEDAFPNQVVCKTEAAAWTSRIVQSIEYRWVNDHTYTNADRTVVISFQCFPETFNPKGGGR